jgi:hypothetical protein
MPDELSAEFFDWLDEQPQRRGGGRIVSVREVAESRSQPREGAPQPASSRFPGMERRRHQLAILTHMLEKEDWG